MNALSKEQVLKRTVSSTIMTPNDGPLMRPNLNLLSEVFHLENEHWWRNPANGEWIERNRGEMYALMHSEISEALEGVRKGGMDKHLPYLTIETVELADFMIRVLDYTGRFKIDLERWLNLMSDAPMFGEYEDNRAELLTKIHRELSWGYDAPTLGADALHLGRAIHRVMKYCYVFGLDLWGAVEDKHAYNATRADHTAAARLAAGGKKF